MAYLILNLSNINSQPILRQIMMIEALFDGFKSKVNSSDWLSHEKHTYKIILTRVDPKGDFQIVDNLGLKFEFKIWLRL